jgi:hypothetical protein
VSMLNVNLGAGPAVNIPCHIPPSFTAEVVLGECTAGCASPSNARALKERGEAHHQWCPARPIRVTCSIVSVDGSWEKSEVVSIETGDLTTEQRLAAMACCRERWALAKALALGHTDLSALLTGPRAVEFLAQRDAVFAALADMARLEDALLTAQYEVDKLQEHGELPEPDHRSWANFRPSTARLAAYVEHLIEQVGAL